jgi:uncharacterized Tic20 family protein
MNEPPPPPLPARDTTNDRLLAVLCHISLLLGFGLLVPLVVFLIIKDQSSYVAEHAKEALNFHITVILAAIVCLMLIFTFIGALVGIPGLFVVGIGSIVLSILATIEAAQDRPYRYPLTLRLVS